MGGETGFAVVARCWTAFAREEKLGSIYLPGMVNNATVMIEGFEGRLWSDVPDIVGDREAAFARLKAMQAEREAEAGPSGLVRPQDFQRNG